MSRASSLTTFISNLKTERTFSDFVVRGGGYRIDGKTLWIRLYFYQDDVWLFDYSVGFTTLTGEEIADLSHEDFIRVDQVLYKSVMEFVTDEIQEELSDPEKYPASYANHAPKDEVEEIMMKFFLEIS